MAELWNADSLWRIDMARRRARALQELTWSFLPRTFASTGVPSDWPLSGFAMLARACGTLSSVMALIPQRRAGDAAVLARTLVEEVVSFAWIAIDPASNADAWLRWDRRQRLKLDNDMRDMGAPAVLLYSGCSSQRSRSICPEWRARQMRSSPGFTSRSRHRTEATRSV